MPDGKYVLPVPETVTMSGSAARKLAGCGSGDAALLYISILLHGGVYSQKDAAAEIRRTEEQTAAALAVLARLELVRTEDGPAAAPVPPLHPAEGEMPAYTADDIRREMDEGEAFPQLVREVQKTLGRVLSSDDLMKLYGIYDYLGLPAEVILQLVTSCRAEYAARYGEGRSPTMRAVERTAYVWEREGVFSIEAAEEYLRRQETRREAAGEIAAAIGISGRALVASEKRYIDSWTKMGFGGEAAAIAYDRTVLKTGKLAWNYMDSILKSWDGKGLHTPEEIAAGDGRGQPRSAPGGKEPGAGATTAEDMDRMRETLRRIKGGS